MSISPQSLARTRDKRSHRIPARFDDFIPPESVYRSIPEPKPATTNIIKKVANEECNNVIKKSSPFHPSITIGSRIRIRPTTNSTTISTPVAEKSSLSADKNASQVEKVFQLTEKSAPTTEKVLLSVEKNTPLIEKNAPMVEKTTPLGDKSTSQTEKGNSHIERSKPLAEKKSASPANIVAPSKKHALNLNDASKQNSRKKAKGFSLMVKQSPPNGPFQNSNTANRTPLPQQQQTKYYNNLAQNMQYGTRLMLNEPIYLPRSVGTIAPVTTTLQQIANQARKPPFLSKKAAAYIAYQEERKFNYLTSTHTALVKITKYLEVQDLLNLRLVNKSWKSIIDSDEVWKKVTLKSARIGNWKKFFNNILFKHQTTELVFDRFNFDSKCLKNLEEVVLNQENSLKRICFRTADKYQNRFVLRFLWNLLFQLKSFNCNVNIRIIWMVKVVVDPQGLALAPLVQEDSDDESELETPNDFLGKGQKLYCYTSLNQKKTNEKNDDVDDDGRTVLVELNDIDELFNGEKTKLALSKSQSKLSVHIGPT